MKVVSTNHDLTQKSGANNKNFPCLPSFTQASGSRIYSSSGKVFLDLGFNGTNNLLGHNISSIHQNILATSNNMPPLNGLIPTNTIVESTLNKLTSIVSTYWHPSFLCSDESIAMDTAMKLAIFYWKEQNYSKKTQFLTLANCHHGYSMGVSSINASNRAYETFAPLISNNEIIPYPETWANDTNIEKKEQITLERLQHYLEEHHENCCGLLIEPLIQSYSGMRICRPSFLNTVCKVIQSYNLLIIADERFTSLYRCGESLAANYLHTKPNITVLGNTLTNNTLPCGAVLIDNRIQQQLSEHLQNPKFKIDHGYQTHLPTLQAMSATLDVISQHQVQDHVKKICKVHESNLHWLQRKPIIKNIRFIGITAAFDIVCERHNQQEALQYWFAQACIDQQLLLPSNKSSIYLLAPYCISEQDIKETYKKIDTILENVPLHYIAHCSNNHQPS